MSEQTFYITDYCTIKAGEVIVNGQVFFSATPSESLDLALFLKRIYKESK